MPYKSKSDLAGRLAHRYFRGGAAPEDAPAPEAEGEICQHYFHGGAAEEHSPSCYDHPDNPMFAEGGEVEDPGIIEAVKRWFRAKPGQESQEAGQQVDEAANAALPESLSAREAVLKQRQRLKDLDEQTKGYAQGGQAEEAQQHLEGADWQDDERNRARSPLAERLSASRLKPSALSRILHKPGTRVP